jgi:hypothetical protein
MKTYIKTEGDCCFNYIILPIKDKVEYPLFDYEKLFHDSLLSPDFSNPSYHTFKHKHLWVKKATGQGVTEFFLQFMALHVFAIMIMEIVRCAW